MSEDLTKEQRKRYKKIFKLFDSNGDKTLSHDEFRVSLDTVGYCLSNEDLEKFISEADVDNSGKITFEEFVNAIHKPTKKDQRDAQLRRMFRVMDWDKSGFITLKDMKNVAKNTPEDNEMTEDEMKAWITRMDDNGDKKVSFAEFSRHMADQVKI